MEETTERSLALLTVAQMAPSLVGPMASVKVKRTAAPTGLVPQMALSWVALTVPVKVKRTA